MINNISLVGSWFCWLLFLRFLLFGLLFFGLFFLWLLFLRFFFLGLLLFRLLLLWLFLLMHSFNLGEGRICSRHSLELQRPSINLIIVIKLLIKSLLRSASQQFLKFHLKPSHFLIIIHDNNHHFSCWFWYIEDQDLLGPDWRHLFCVFLARSL